MSTGARSLAAAALLVAFGIWAGARMYSAHSALQSHHGVPAPAGEASPPNAGDLAYTDAAPESPDRGDAFPRPKIPDRLPQFSLESSAGKATPIASFGGKSLIINFWATWCAPCRSEIPLLQTLHAEWAGRDVTVVGIAVDHRDPVLAFAQRYKIGYPLLIGEQDALDAAAAFGLESPVFPFTVFTDRRGEVVALFIGELHRPQAELILSEVQNLNKDLVQLPEARRAIAEGLSALAQKRPG
jgi:thiol-disulfide isomerase/thioredoxin